MHITFNPSNFLIKFSFFVPLSISLDALSGISIVRLNVPSTPFSQRKSSKCISSSRATSWRSGRLSTPCVGPLLRIFCFPEAPSLFWGVILGLCCSWNGTKQACGSKATRANSKLTPPLSEGVSCCGWPFWPNHASEAWLSAACIRYAHCQNCLCMIWISLSMFSLENVALLHNIQHLQEHRLDHTTRKFLEIEWPAAVQNVTLLPANDSSSSHTRGQFRENDLVLIVCETELGFPISKDKEELSGKTQVTSGHLTCIL